MKVMLFLHDLLPYSSGAGPSIMTWALVNELFRHGHEVVICRYDFSNDERLPWLKNAKGTLLNLGFRIYDIPSLSVVSKPSRVSRVRKALFPRLSDFYPVRIDKNVLLDLLEKEKPDLLYLFTMKSVACLTELKLNLLPPMISSLIDLDTDLLSARRKYLDYASRLEFIYKILDRLAERKLAYFIINSLKQCNLVIDHASHHAQWLSKHGINSIYLPNPVEDPLSRESSIIGIAHRGNSPKMKVSLIGNIHGVSTIAGFDYFVKSLLPILTPADRQFFQFHVIGKGSAPLRIRSVLSRESSVIIRGYVENIQSEFLSTDILLVPTPISLGFRTRIAEGFAYGCVVVAHDANRAGMPELKSGENCILFTKPGDCINALHLLRNDHKLYLKISQNARRTFEESYSGKVVCHQMIDLFESTL